MKKLSLVIAGLLASSQLHALGIGEAQLHSHIGEPLDITVPLYLDADELAAIQQLRASIGDRAMFERMHLEYRDTLRQMNVVVEQQGRNTLLRIQSDTRFSEPMAEFPLDVSLAGSRLVRTVTLLLDPPPLQVAAPSSRPAPVSRRETTRPAPTSSVAPRRTTVATGSPVITTKRDGEHYGPVAVNQTLGEIAQAVRPSDANLNQTLVALWELNPDAFIGNNMNRLMAGSTLRIPDRERILAISPAEAQRQVVAQYQQMKAPTRTVARPVVTEPAPASPVQQQAATPEKDAVTAPQAATSTAEAPASEEARLSLLAPSNIEQIPEIFQEEVKLLGEQLRGLNEENTELRDRIGELERHISTLSQQMVALAENTLALSGAEEDRIAQLLAQIESENRSGSAETASTAQETPPTEAPLTLAAEPTVLTEQSIEGSHIWRYAAIGGVLLLSVGVAGMWFRRLRQRERYRDVMYRI